MNAESLPLTPTTQQRAKMASVSIRQTSLMQVTRHAESTEIQYVLVARAVQQPSFRPKTRLCHSTVKALPCDAPTATGESPCIPPVCWDVRVAGAPAPGPDPPAWSAPE